MRFIRHQLRLGAAVALLGVAACETTQLVDPNTGDPVWVSVTPATGVLRAIGATLQLTVVNAMGAPVTVSGLTWRTIEPGIVEIDGTGRVTAVGPGTARIVIETVTRADTVTIEVRQDVAVVTVTPAPVSLEVGGTRQLAAGLADPNGHPVAGRDVTWTTSAAGVATVSGAGLVTGAGAGTAVITARSDETTGTVTVTVTSGPPPPPPPPDGTAPSVPQNVAAVAAGATLVNVGWTPSTDNVGVTGYRVFRNGTQVGTPAAPAYQDASVSPSTTYSYTVAAVDAAGNVSAQSDPASVITPAGGGIGSALPARLGQSNGTVFYVSTTGADGNPGTLAQPWRTVQKAMSTLTAGQKALVRGGVYREDLSWTRAGTASNPITIENYPGETPIIDSEFTGGGLEIGSTGAYLRLKGFIFEHDCCTSGGHVDVYGHHIEIIGNEMRDGRGKGVYTDESSHHVHIIGNWMHHNVTVGGQQDHGIYLQGDDHFVANNVIHDHPDGFGIQAYDKGARYIIVNNTVTNNGHSGIVVGGSGGVSDVIIRNNILANNSRYGVQHDSSCPTANVLVENNVIFGNGSGAVQSGCSAITATGNIASDPMFVDPSSRNLRVRSGSPAIDAGRLDMSMPSDFMGAARGAQPDIGAYEFGTGTASLSRARSFDW